MNSVWHMSSFNSGYVEKSMVLLQLLRDYFRFLRVLFACLIMFPLFLAWQRQCQCVWKGVYPDNKVHGANMGPIWGRQDPGGPYFGPMNFAIWVVMCESAPRLTRSKQNIIISYYVPIYVLRLSIKLCCIMLRLSKQWVNANTCELHLVFILLINTLPTIPDLRRQNTQVIPCARNTHP